MERFRWIKATLLLWGLAIPSLSHAFDQSHAAFIAVLARHVTWETAGTSSSVDYAGLQHDRGALSAYSDSLSRVTADEFGHWTSGQRRAFLLNAYNAFTVELILTRYPDLTSIRDLGHMLFLSPWKKRFFTLLGATRSLDEVERVLLREAPGFDDPHIHFALNCASVGCPALRPEAYRAEVLGAQLDDQVSRFLRDRTRNHYVGGPVPTAYVSPLFRWYAMDFEAGFQGITSVQVFLARYATALGDSATDRARIRSAGIRLAYTEYDWSLNATSRVHHGV